MDNKENKNKQTKNKKYFFTLLFYAFISCIFKEINKGSKSVLY